MVLIQNSEFKFGMERGERSYLGFAVLGGVHDKQMAAALGLSLPTVRTHLRRLSANVGVADRVELVLRIFRIVCELRGPCGRIHHK